MNTKHYNNVIDWTLKHDTAAQTEDSLATARVIFNNMGVALPNGNMQEVYDTIKTNQYMGWRACTMQEAQEAADKGTAAIGISKDRVVVLSATDEEEPVAETASVMTLSENTSAYSVAGLEYYTYNCSTTNPGSANVSVRDVLNKPYDPNYRYTLNGNPNNISEAQYYTLLNGYSYEIRNDIVFDFTFQEIDSFRSYLVSSLFKTSTQQEREQVVEDIFALAGEAVSIIVDRLPVEWPGKILDAISVASTVTALNSDSVQDDIRDITDCVEVFSHKIQGQTSTPKPNSVTYRISLLKQSPLTGRQIKIESSDGCKDIYTLENGAYEMALMTAMANAHGFTLYKVAPEWSYYWE